MVNQAPLTGVKDEKDSARGDKPKKKHTKGKGKKGEDCIIM